MNKVLALLTLTSLCWAPHKAEAGCAGVTANLISRFVVQQAIEDFIEEMQESAPIAQGVMAFNRLTIEGGSERPAKTLLQKWIRRLRANTPGGLAVTSAEMADWVEATYPHWSDDKIEKALIHLRHSLALYAPNQDRQWAGTDVKTRSYESEKGPLLKLAAAMVKARAGAAEAQPEFPTTAENLAHTLWGGVYEFKNDHDREPTVSMSRAKKYRRYVLHGTSPAQREKLLPLIDQFEELVGGPWVQ